VIYDEFGTPANGPKAASETKPSGERFLSLHGCSRWKSKWLRRIVVWGVGWLYWPCVPGRRPRPNGIDAPS